MFTVMLYECRGLVLLACVLCLVSMSERLIVVGFYISFLSHFDDLLFCSEVLVCGSGCLDSHLPNIHNFLCKPFMACL